MFKNISKSNRSLRQNVIVSFLVIGSIITTVPTVHGKTVVNPILLDSLSAMPVVDHTKIRPCDVYEFNRSTSDPISAMPVVDHTKIRPCDVYEFNRSTSDPIIVSTEAIIKFKKELSKEQHDRIAMGLNAKVSKLMPTMYLVSSYTGSFESMKQFFKKNAREIPYVYIEKNHMVSTPDPIIIVDPIKPDPSKPDPIIVSTEAIIKFNKELSKKQLNEIVMGLNAKVSRLMPMMYLISSYTDSTVSFETIKNFFKKNYKKFPYEYIEKNHIVSTPDPIITVDPIKPDPSNT